MEVPQRFVLDLSGISLEYSEFNLLGKALLGTKNLTLSYPYSSLDDNIKGEHIVMRVLEGELSRYEPADFENRISLYKQTFSKLQSFGVKNVTVLTTQGIEECRAIAIASKEEGLSVGMTFFVNDEGEAEDGSHCAMAYFTLCKMNISHFILACSDKEALSVLTKELATICDVPLGVLNEGNGYNTLIKQAETYMQSGADFIALSGNADYNVCTECARIVSMHTEDALEKDRYEDIVCAGAGQLFFISENPDISTNLECSYDMSEEIIALEDDGYDILSIALETEDDGYFFAINAHMCSMPVIFVTHNEESLDYALRHYHGIALIDRLCETDISTLSKYAEKYGAIVM